VRALPDPVGKGTEKAGRAERHEHRAAVRVPLGVIGLIYESRPNVTADAGALCSRPQRRDPARRLRTATIPTAPSMRRSRGLQAAGRPEGAIQLVPTRDAGASG